MNGASPTSTVTRRGKSGSCIISLKGPHAGDWHEFDGEQGGGPISAISQATGLDGAALIVEAAEIAGVAPGAPERQAPSTPAPVASANKRDAAQDIAHILSGALPIAGTAAERYLAGRGLAAAVGADLQFHPDLTHWDTKSGYPAMLGLVRDRGGKIIGLHRTYLE